MRLLQELHEEGMAIVLVTHDPEIARYSRRTVPFRDGRIVADEAVEDSEAGLKPARFGQKNLLIRGKRYIIIYYAPAV